MSNKRSGFWKQLKNNNTQMEIFTLMKFPFEEGFGQYKRVNNLFGKLYVTKNDCRNSINTSKLYISLLITDKLTHLFAGH